MFAPETLAPDFELYCTPDQKLKLSELRGKKIILHFILRSGARMQWWIVSLQWNDENFFQA